MSLLALIAVLLVSCKDKKKEETLMLDGVEFTKAEYAAIEQSIDSFMNAKDRYLEPDSIRKLLMASDSIQELIKTSDTPWIYDTPEQRAVDSLYAEIHLQHVKFMDGELVLDFTLEDFKKTGMNEAYYHSLVEYYKHVNFVNRAYKRTVDFRKIEWERSREESRKMLEIYKGAN